MATDGLQLMLSWRLRQTPPKMGEAKAQGLCGKQNRTLTPKLWVFQINGAGINYKQQTAGINSKEEKYIQSRERYTKQEKYIKK